jgi:Mg2+ and Co2+ transporter CorA
MAGALAGLRALTLPLVPDLHRWNIVWFAGMILLGIVIYLGALFLIRRRLPAYVLFDVL